MKTKRKIAVLGNGWAFEFVNSILEGIKEATKDTNTDIYYFSCYKFHNPDKSPNNTGYRFFDLIEYSDFDGVIILGNLFEDEDSLLRVSQRIVEQNIPAVSLVRGVNDLPHIYSNNYIGFIKLIDHLFDKHNIKTPAFIGGITNDVQSEERYNAFKDSATKHNIKLNKDHIIKNTDWSYKAGLETGLKLLENSYNRPDAIVCSNDRLAFGVLHAADSLNIQVPKDLKIIGFDNENICKRIIPSISTVTPNAKELGKKAISVLFSKKTQPKKIEIKSTVKIRQSCGCKKHISEEQLKYGFRISLVQDEEERFSTHLRHTEDIFLNDNNIHMFWENCQDFFVTRHEFEGDNFSILLKKDLIQSILYQEQEYNDANYAKEFQVFVNINNGKKVSPSVIDSREIMPPNLHSTSSSVYYFIPLVYRQNFFGYYVTKDNLKLLFNKRGYTWSKNFANSIQKFREKTKYRLLSQKYLGLSTQDALSGIYNRAAIDLFGADLYETNRHSNLYTIIVFLDINNLKKINDRYGHLHGDLVIKIVAEEIKNSIPEKWIPIRYGGDEFVVIGTANSDSTNNYFDILNDKLVLKKEQMSLPYDLSISIGSITVPPDSILTLQAEINNADSVMYRNKQLFHEKEEKRQNH